MMLIVNFNLNIALIAFNFRLRAENANKSFLVK